MSTSRYVPTAPSLLLALACCGWAGCNLAPKYARPSVDTPAQFREAANRPASDLKVNWTPAHPNDEQSRGSWWKFYGDAQLNTLEAQVDVSNPTIAAAAANLRAARGAVVSARSAFFPTISADPSVTRGRVSQTLATTTPTSPSLVDEYSLPLDASYELDLWGRVRNTVAASRANAEASAADLATAQLSIQAELAQDYFQLRALDSEQEILDDTVASYRQSLHDTQALFRAGIDSEEDVSRAQTQLDTTIAQATDLGVSRTAFEHAIAVLIGKAPANFSLAVAPLVARPPQFPVTLPSQLLERRPDIASAERRVAAANAQIGVARAAYFPSLVLSASAGWETGELARWFDWPSRFWSVGPELAQTLFDGGARFGQSEQARAGFDQAAANYRQTVLTAFQNVEDNLSALRILEREAQQQALAVESSRHLLTLTNTRYKDGIDSYLNVITAQTTLLSNRETDVQIQLRRVTASIALVKALGGGWTVAELKSTGSG